MILKTGIGLGGFSGKIDALDSYLEKGAQVQIAVGPFEKI